MLFADKQYYEERNSDFRQEGIWNIRWRKMGAFLPADFCI